MAPASNQVGGHVAVLAFPFSTHAAPLLNIVCRLASAAPNTLFSFFNTKQSNSSILASNTSSILRNSNVRVCEVADGVPEGYVFVGKPQEDIELFMKAAPDNFRRCLEASVAETGRKVSCLVTDAFFWFGAHMADDLGGLPWVPFWTAGPASLSAHVHTDLIRNTTSMGGHDGKETITVVAGMSKVRPQDLPEGIIFGKLDSLFSRMLHQMGLMLPLATAVFINSFEELDPVITNDLKSKFKRYLNVGPFDLLESPAPAATTTLQTGDVVVGDGCLSWLDKQKAASVVYVSFGSVTRPSPEELMALAEALEASRVPFLWSLRNNLKTPKLDEYISKAELNGMVVPWVPQPQVLAHGSVGAFVTHCGWNSVLESVAGGVPMICRPFFGDQKLNARMVEDEWKIGLKLEHGVFTKNGMLKSLDILLSQKKGDIMRDKINTFKQLAQQAVEPKGSSTRNFESLLEVISTAN
ncbi:anthocyanidin 3-O-glucosyltransferase 2 [Rosa rugosa]|uniref:anthocyanidin 3-O-glucosyltransferase 2 n=1 Tax=Rosa rugosa TaxID=74645 RepID=UPI002B402678|nr:anthocyanidin 3-O-glucosyltransferase 2 [Rosa rugosa]